jgi:phage virion morphogenesis protein
MFYLFNANERLMSDGLVLKFSLRDMGMGRTIQEVADRLENPQKMLSEIGLVMLSSIKRNFQEGGRPVPWKPSARAIAQHGQTLVDTRRLEKSINMRVYENRVWVGTNLIYAAIHHFGGTIDKTVQVKGYTRIYKKSDMKIKSNGKWYYPISHVASHSRHINTTIPERPYMMLQDEDWETIKRIGYDYLIPVQGMPV